VVVDETKTWYEMHQNPFSCLSIKKELHTTTNLCLHPSLLVTTGAGMIATAVSHFFPRVFV
jgi:hypothetical protein